MGVHSSEYTPIAFWGKEDEAREWLGPVGRNVTGGDPDTRMSCTVFHTAPRPQTRTMTGKRTALPTRVRTSVHRRQVDSELGPAKLACGFVCQSAIFLPCSQSIRLIGDWLTSLKIGCERIFRIFPFRENMHPLHPKDGVNTCCKMVYGESAGARTQDQRLKRAMLYQLSYALLPPNNGSTSSP